MLHKRAGAAFAHRKIGLLGGSFNPAHEGHRAMSLYALKRLGLDQIWWLVSPQNPLKPDTGMASYARRLAKARARARHPKILVTDIEQQLGTRYTVDTLRALRKRFPRARFVWLMGADNFLQIPRWRKWAEIFSLVPVAIFRRPGYAAGRGKAAQRFMHSRKAGNRLTLGQQPPVWFVLHNPLNPLSATEIRKERKWQN